MLLDNKGTSKVLAVRKDPLTIRFTSPVLYENENLATLLDFGSIFQSVRLYLRSSDL